MGIGVRGARISFLVGSLGWDRGVGLGRCSVPERMTRRAVLVVKRVSIDYFFSLAVR